MMRDEDKIAISKVERTTILMDYDNKYISAISNIDIDAARDLVLTNIKKSW